MTTRIDCHIDGSRDMGSHMKTTVEISDALLDEARRAAERRGVTLRTLVEEGLRHAVKAGLSRPGFRLRSASFRGEGLASGFAEPDWARTRDTIYRGHGA